MGAAAGDLVDLIVSEARERNARVIGITGGIAVGKSTVAAPVSTALAMPVVSTDGFIFPAEVLTARDLMGRKGFPESYDVDALVAFVDDIRGQGRRVGADLFASLLRRDRHRQLRDAGDCRRWSPPRSPRHATTRAHRPARAPRRWRRKPQGLVPGALQPTPRAARRTTRAHTCTPTRDMTVDAMNEMALGVWAAVNQIVIDEEIRPLESCCRHRRSASRPITRSPRSPAADEHLGALGHRVVLRRLDPAVGKGDGPRPVGVAPLGAARRERQRQRPVQAVQLGVEFGNRRRQRQDPPGLAADRDSRSNTNPRACESPGPPMFSSPNSSHSKRTWVRIASITDAE